MLRNKIYYRVKPFIPPAVRTAVRRKVVRRLRNGVGNIWPIMPGSERLPQSWEGWPNGKKFALVLTHDVEGRAGLARCRDLMKLEMDLGFRSSFNFVPEGEYRVPRELREELTQNGFEVGLHDLRHDGRLFESKREFSRNASRINHYVADWGAAGFRSGFMLHKLEWLHELKVKYDASTFDTDPFEPQPEGRHTIFPFWVPAPEVEISRAIKHQTSNIKHSGGGYVELPYTLPQDSTLFLLLGETTIDIWKRKLDWIAENGGMALLITHPDYMSFRSKPDRTDGYSAALYTEFLQYAQSRYGGQYWHPLPNSIAEFVVQQKCELASGDSAEAKHPISTGINGTNGKLPPASLDRLRGKRAAVLLFSYYPADPRPRRAAEALAREGLIVDLICLQQNWREARREMINGVNVLRIPVKRSRGGQLRYVFQYSSFILRCFFHLTFRSLLRRYHLVHVHNMPDVLVFSALVPKMLGAKIVLDLHDPMPELMQSIFGLSQESWSVRFLKRLEQWSIQFSDAVITVNEACRRIYSSRSCSKEKVSVVMNAPSEELFPLSPPAFNSNGRNGDSSRPFAILYHGSLVPRNGFDLAVEALRTATKSVPAAELWVCGERTPFFDQVMANAEKSGIGHAVHYLGPKDRHEIADVIRRCDVGVIPNQRNIFTEINTPTRIFECLTLGRPVIAPRAAGIQDYFGDDDLIFFDLGDANDLARKIEFTFSQPESVARIVERGQQVYRAHSWTQEKSVLLQTLSNLF